MCARFTSLKDAFIKNNRAFFDASGSGWPATTIHQLSLNFRTTQQNCNLNAALQDLIVFNDPQE